MEVTDEDKSNISNKNARINSQVQYTQLHQQKRSSTLEQIYSLKRILILRANQLWFKQDVKQYVSSSYFHYHNMIYHFFCAERLHALLFYIFPKENISYCHI